MGMPYAVGSDGAQSQTSGAGSASVMGRAKAVYASRRPEPSAWLGKVVEGMPPHICDTGFVTFVDTDLTRMQRVKPTRPRSAGLCDQRSAAVPATCGAAMEVPLLMLCP